MKASASTTGTSSSAWRPGAARSDLPPVHERLAKPETQEEYFHGELRLKMPSNPPHARQHIRLAYVLEAHVAEGYLGAVEMLTRTGRKTDFAPDASVYPEDPDPATGGRRIEELAFEVCSEQSLEVPTTKARALVTRGVRRVFCIVVGGTSGQRRRRRLKESYLLEWSRKTNNWSRVPPDTVITDPCLDPPLQVKGLLHATDSDEVVARALRARGSRVFEEERAAGFTEGQAKGLAEGEAKGRAEGEAKGRATGLAEAVLVILEGRGLALSDEARQRIGNCRDLTQLELWMRRALVVDTVDDL